MFVLYYNPDVQTVLGYMPSYTNHLYVAVALYQFPYTLGVENVSIAHGRNVAAGLQ